MNMRYHHVKKIETLSVNANQATINITSIQKHTTVWSVKNVDLMRSKNSHVSLNILLNYKLIFHPVEAFILTLFK